MIRRTLICFLLALASVGAWAQLTQPQRAALKTYIDATPALASAVQVGNVGQVVAALNAQSTDVVLALGV